MNKVTRLSILFFMTLQYLYATYTVECLMDRNECNSKNMNNLNREIPFIFSDVENWYKSLGFPLPPVMRDLDSNKVIKMYDIDNKRIVSGDVDCGDKDFSALSHLINPKDSDFFNWYSTMGCAFGTGKDKKIYLNYYYFKSESKNLGKYLLDTIAHEMYHTIQSDGYAISLLWLIEGTATAVGEAYIMHRGYSYVNGYKEEWDVPLTSSELAYGRNIFFYGWGNGLNLKIKSLT